MAKPKNKPCNHHSQSLKVVNANCGCETVVTICDNCKKILSKPKTDC